jgi:hypothetical protein
VGVTHLTLVFTDAHHSTSIGIGHATRATFTELHVTMTDVPIKYLDHLEARFRKSLRRIAKQGFDMKRLRAIIDRDERMVSRVFAQCKDPP